MAEPILMPKLGFDMAEGTLINWLKGVGDAIGKGDVIAEIETDKATIEIETAATGTILKLLAKPGDVLPIGSVIGYVGTPGEAVPDDGGTAPAPAEATPEAAPAEAAAPAPTVAVPPGNGSAYPGGVKASPLARRVAAEKGVDLRLVSGSGPGGRVVKRDVEGFVPQAVAPAAPPAAAPAIPAHTTYGALPEGPDVDIIDLNKLRARIGNRMVTSKQQTPHFYVTTEIDVAALLELRQELNARLEDEGIKITVNDLIVKAAALILRQFPNLNTHFYGDKLARHKRIHIGMAVALPGGGLINVIARDADRTALGTMAAQNKAAIARAREGKVRPDDVEGSTFTVSNLGPYDVEQFVAIINPPEAAILAIGTAKQVPVVKEDGTLGVGHRMKATISVDHRVSDGAEGAQFMQAFKQLVENPLRLLV